MCDPVSIAATTAVVAAASSVMGFEGAQQASQANEQAANLSASNTYNALQEQEGQIDAQQSENTVSAVIGRAQQQGRISASASSFGTGGATAEELGNAADNTAGRALSIEDFNSASQRLQVQNQLQSSDIARRNKIASVPAPDPLTLVLGIAKAGLSGTSAYTSAGGRFSGGSSGVNVTGSSDAASIADSVGV
jgi:hypothetical protein